MADYDEVAQSLHEMIIRDRMWQVVAEDVRDHGTDWYSRFLGRLTLAAGRDEVHLLSSRGTYSADESTFDGEVVVFLKEVYVVASANRVFDGVDDAATEVTVFGRRPLSNLAVVGGTAAWPRSSWPGRLRVLLTWETHPALELPLSTMPDPAEYAELDQLLPSLRSDLYAG